MYELVTVKGEYKLFSHVLPVVEQILRLQEKQKRKYSHQTEK